MPFQGNNRTLARNIRKKEYNITAPRVRRVFFQFASLKTTEAMHVLEKAVQEEKKNILSAVETIKERANLFEAELK